MTMFQIEDNVPIPHTSTKSDGGEYIRSMSKLKVGQSVLYAQTQTERNSRLAYFKLKHMPKGWTLVSRKVEGGYRVWRVI